VTDLQKTYELEVPPVEALSWSDHRQWIRESWKSLLNRDPAAPETEVQKFFEEHPSLVPGALGSGACAGKYPDLLGVIRQAPLPSYDKRIPDFLWLSGNSGIVQPVLVEIEAPDKPWFTASNVQSYQLTQALDQIAEWKAWFNVPHNVQAFRDFYHLDRGLPRKQFAPTYVLVFGRRAEANANAARLAKRRSLAPANVEIMTFDRLAPEPGAEELCCLEATSGHSFRVVSVPPSLCWSPLLAGERLLCHGWDEAIRSNPHIPESRKAFLIRRRPYWEEWVRRGGGLVTGGDCE